MGWRLILEQLQSRVPHQSHHQDLLDIHLLEHQEDILVEHQEDILVEQEDILVEHQEDIPVEHQEDILLPLDAIPTLVEQEHHAPKLVLGAHHIQVELQPPHILEQKNKLLLCLICK